jgi:hypothetical protein
MMEREILLLNSQGEKEITETGNPARSGQKWQEEIWNDQLFFVVV